MIEGQTSRTRNFCFFTFSAFLDSLFSFLPSLFSLLPSPFSLLSSLFSLLSSLFSLLSSLFSLLSSLFSLLPSLLCLLSLSSSLFSVPSSLLTFWLSAFLFSVSTGELGLAPLYRPGGVRAARFSKFAGPLAQRRVRSRPLPSFLLYYYLTVPRARPPQGPQIAAVHPSSNTRQFGSRPWAPLGSTFLVLGRPRGRSKNQ